MAHWVILLPFPFLFLLQTKFRLRARAPLECARNFVPTPKLSAEAPIQVFMEVLATECSKRANRKVRPCEQPWAHPTVHSYGPAYGGPAALLASFRSARGPSPASRASRRAD